MEEVIGMVDALLTHVQYVICEIERVKRMAWEALWGIQFTVWYLRDIASPTEAI